MESKIKAMKQKLQEYIGREVKSKRCVNGISQTELAYALGLTRVSIINIEGGRQSVTNLHLWQLSQLFNCHPSDFFPKKCDMYIPLNDFKSKEFKKIDIDKRISQLEAKLVRLKELEFKA